MAFFFFYHPEANVNIWLKYVEIMKSFNHRKSDHISHQRFKELYVGDWLNGSRWGHEDTLWQPKHKTDAVQAMSMSMYYQFLKQNDIAVKRPDKIHVIDTAVC